MTTPSPDKLEIPEAAVEAMCDVASRVWGLPLGRQEALHLIASILPHMPDRGYAEGIEAATKVARDNTPDKHNGTLAAHVTGATIEAAIRALAPSAPADNGEPSRCPPCEAAQISHCSAPEFCGERVPADEAEIDRLRLVAFRSNSEVDRLAYFLAASKWFQDRHYRALSATPSPIEDVAEPSEAEIEDAHQEGYNEGYEEGKSEWRGVKAQLWNAMQHWLTLRHGLVDTTGEGYTVNDLLDGLAEVEAENKRLSDFVGRHTALAEAAETAIAFLIEKFVPPYEPWMDDFKDGDAITSFYRGGSTYGDLRRAIAARRVRPSPVEVEYAPSIEALTAVSKDICERLVGKQSHDEKNVAAVAMFLRNCLTTGILQPGLFHPSPVDEDARDGVLADAIRICPERDGPCPHGDSCPHSIDHYSCNIEASRASLQFQRKG